MATLSLGHSVMWVSSRMVDTIDKQAFDFDLHTPGRYFEFRSGFPGVNSEHEAVIP